MTEETQVQDAPVDAPPPITDVNAFGQLVLNWHHNALGQIRHMATVPEDVAITFSDTDGSSYENLTAEQRVGFRAGLSAAMSVVERLPFQFSVTDGEGAEDTVPAEAASPAEVPASE